MVVMAQLYTVTVERAALLGRIVKAIQAKMDDLKKGTSRVVEAGGGVGGWWFARGRVLGSAGRKQQPRGGAEPPSDLSDGSASRAPRPRSDWCCAGIVVARSRD